MDNSYEMTATMAKRVEAMFNPCIKLYWKGRGGKLTNHYYPDTIADRDILRQFMNEAGLPRNGVKISVEQYDAVLAVAGKYGYSIETNGEPDVN